MNVALPSTYRFMEKVIQEIVAMYKEAGAPLTTIHLGGDEVAKGAWMGSPLCRALMEEQGMEKAHDLAEYFITRVADCRNSIICLLMAGRKWLWGIKRHSYLFIPTGSRYQSWKTVPNGKRMKYLIR